MAKTPMTTRGAELLRAELHRLKTADRPNVIAAIAEARAHGDLSENAEYDAARAQQGFIEGRISELEAKLGNAQIIDPKLLEILVCPVTKGPLVYDRERSELVSKRAGLAYPIRDGLPIMLAEEARPLDAAELA